jgi:hypothetical protein
LGTGATTGDTITTISFYVSSVLNAIPATAGSVSDSYIVSMSSSKLTGTQTIPKATLPTGCVLQVVQGTSSTQFDTTSTSFVATNLQVSITPSSATSKIYISVTGGVGTSGSTVQPVYTIYRNSTDLGVNNRGFGQAYSGAGGMNSSGAMVYLDSPATTSATTYRVYLRTNSGTATWGFDSGLQVIVVMEIAA